MVPPSLKLKPSDLPPGTRVGPWLVKAYQGGGAYGGVFRAVRAGREHGGLVALKVAWNPRDPRFPREVVLLSRIHHPSVPRLLDHGDWQHPGGSVHPYLVMEWAEGVPLYEWAAQQNPTQREVLGVLAQIAGALAATHAAGCVHRDVKGGNILVGDLGTRSVLTDFGAGNYAGAAPLTRDGLPPGTDNYRSPEAWEFELRRPRNSAASYGARPADDVFALGVTAYRLVTGQYLPPVEVVEEEEGPGRLKWTAPLAPVEVNPWVDASFSSLILRMISERLEARPAARELAETWEGALRNAGPELDRPLFARRYQEPAREDASANQQEVQGHDTAHARARLSPERGHLPVWPRYLASAVLGGLVAAVGVQWGLRHEQEGKAGVAVWPVPDKERRGDDLVDLGDMGLTGPMCRVQASPSWGSMSAPMPEKPFTGQLRAPDDLDHRFRAKPITDSGASRSPIPGQADH